MLRNAYARSLDTSLKFLNEVLSLNAQELCSILRTAHAISILNEVLSLNAQECWMFSCVVWALTPQ